MNEDDRKKYIEELMQPHIPLRVLQEIRTEIADRAQWHYSHNQEDVAMIISCEALEIIDKHIKEIEE